MELKTFKDYLEAYISVLYGRGEITVQERASLGNLMLMVYRGAAKESLDGFIRFIKEN